MIKKIASLFKNTALFSSWSTLANVLTLSRIALAPVLGLFIYHHRWPESLTVLVLAGVTDVLDGYCARTYGGGSDLGILLDPLADKILLLTSFCALLFAQTYFVMPVWFIVFLVMREVIMMCGSLCVMAISHRVSVAPTTWGKLTTLFQIIFLAWLIVCFIMSWNPQKSYRIALVALALFSTFSLIDYIKIGIKQMRT